MILLDTNVIPEIMRPLPERRVVEWLRSQPESDIYTTAITEAEMLKGIEMMASKRRRSELEEVIRQYFHIDMASKILPFDSAAARWFGQLFVMRRSKGLPVSPLDLQIAAIARAHNATLATRNTKDFEHCGIQLLDPWKHR